MADLSQRKTHGLAIASLVLGCFFLIPILGLLFSLLAIIFGAIALSAISSKKETYKGSGLAIGGIILGVIGIIIIPIIMLLAAIAIPNFVRARSSAQESAAVAAMRTIAVAEVQYRATHPAYASLSALAGDVPPYIDSKLGSGFKYGYTFALTILNPLEFYVVSVPEIQGPGRTFYIDEDGVLCRSDSYTSQSVSGHQAEGCPAGFSEMR